MGKTIQELKNLMILVKRSSNLEFIFGDASTEAGSCRKRQKP